MKGYNISDQDLLKKVLEDLAAAGVKPIFDLQSGSNITHARIEGQDPGFIANIAIENDKIDITLTDNMYEDEHHLILPCDQSNMFKDFVPIHDWIESERLVEMTMVGPGVELDYHARFRIESCDYGATPRRLSLHSLDTGLVTYLHLLKECEIGEEIVRDETITVIHSLESKPVKWTLNLSDHLVRAVHRAEGLTS